MADKHTIIRRFVDKYQPGVEVQIVLTALNGENEWTASDVETEVGTDFAPGSTAHAPGGATYMFDGTEWVEET